MPHIDTLWAKMPVTLMSNNELTATDKIVYGVIAAFAGGRSRWFGPVKEIAEVAGCSVRSVESAVPKLVRLGYLRTERQGMARMTVNEYTVLAQVRQLPDERPANNNGSVPQPVADAKTQNTDIEEEDAARAEKWDCICKDLGVNSGVDSIRYWNKVQKVPEPSIALQRLIKEFSQNWNHNLRLVPGSVKRLELAAEIVAPLDLNDAAFTSSLQALDIKHSEFLQNLAKEAVDWGLGVYRSYGKVDLG